MPSPDEFDWRDRAVALASLGAVTLGRNVFQTADVLGERPMQPVEMQVLVALALGETLADGPPKRVDMQWLDRTLGLERWVTEAIVEGLTRAGLVSLPGDARSRAEAEHPQGGADAGEEAVEVPPIVITESGLRIVVSWLQRTRRHFPSWPPERRDVDDVIG